MRRFVIVLACLAQTAGASARDLPASFERAVLAELNRARERPADVARDLRRYRASMRGRVVHEPGATHGVITHEGAAAVDEAIAFLEAQGPLPSLADSAPLARAARALMVEQAVTGAVGHASRDGLGAVARVRAAAGNAHVGETIAYGFDGPAAAVRQLIVDDGVPDRGHRRLVFSHHFRFAGVSCASHPRHRRACTVDYAGVPLGRTATRYASR